MTIKEFVEKHNLYCDIHRIPFRLDVDQDRWNTEAKHYAYSVFKQRSAKNYNTNKIQGYYSQGSGIKSPPKIEDILNALLVDTLGIEGVFYDSWAGEYGYNTDSIKGLEIYQACLKELKQLKKLFTPEELAVFYECEQL